MAKTIYYYKKVFAPRKKVLHGDSFGCYKRTRRLE